MLSVSDALERFEKYPAATAKLITERMEREPAAFCKELVPALRSTKEGPGLRHLLWLISGSKLLSRVLCDPGLFTDEEARSLAERLREIEPSVQSKLSRELFGPDGGSGASLENPEYGLRFLQVFGGNTNTIGLLVGRLLRHPDAKIRSKAAVLIGKVSRQYEWLEQTRQESDDRVRANALEALWAPGIPQHLCALLWEAARDSSNRVAGNALFGLYRQGQAGCIPLITEMAGHPDEKFRATAAWVMGETRDDRFRQYLLPLLTDVSALVRENAQRALAKLDEEAAFAGLEKLHLVPFFPDSIGNAAGSALRLGVTSQQRSTRVPTLVSVDFRIKLGSSLVERYTVELESAPGVLSLAFAVPASDANGISMQAKWRGVFSQIFAQKRRLDYWALLAGGQLRFVRNSLELDNVFASQSKMAAPVPFEDSIKLALTPPPFAAGVPGQQFAMHAVVISSAPSAGIRPERLAAMKDLAITRNFRVHVVTPNASDNLAQLAEATGGALMVCPPDFESWQRALLALHGALLATYKIEFQSPDSQDARDTDIQIAVRRGPLLGEIRIPSAAQK